MVLDLDARNFYIDEKDAVPAFILASKIFYDKYSSWS